MATMIAIWDDVDINRWGDEYQIFCVATADDDGEPIGTIYQYTNETGAQNLAEQMGRDRRLPIERM